MISMTIVYVVLWLLAFGLLYRSLSGQSHLEYEVQQLEQLEETSDVEPTFPPSPGL